MPLRAEGVRSVAQMSCIGVRALVEIALQQRALQADNNMAGLCLHGDRRRTDLEDARSVDRQASVATEHTL